MHDSELTVEQMRAALGWFVDCWEDRDYPAYTGPETPIPAYNPRMDILGEMREQIGIDLAPHAIALVAECDQQAARYA